MMYWQTEDLIRAYKFDIDKLLSSKAFEEEFEAAETKDWLRELAESMENEKVKEVGHTSHSKSIIATLEAKHLTKLADGKYNGLFEPLKPAISAYSKQKPGLAKPIFILFELLYAFYLQKLSGAEMAETIENLGNQAAHCLNELVND